MQSTLYWGAVAFILETGENITNDSIYSLTEFLLDAGGLIGLGMVCAKHVVNMAGTKGCWTPGGGAGGGSHHTVVLRIVSRVPVNFLSIFVLYNIIKI